MFKSGEPGLNDFGGGNDEKYATLISSTFYTLYYNVSVLIIQNIARY